MDPEINGRRITAIGNRIDLHILSVNNINGFNLSSIRQLLYQHFLAVCSSPNIFDAFL